MKKVSNLMLAVYALGAQAIFQGQQNTASRKSFATSYNSLNRQLQALTDSVAVRPLQGRKRLDLLSSLEEDAVVIPINDNAIYKQIKELMVSLEEDAYQVVNGNQKAATTFRKNHKLAISAMKTLRVSLGVSSATKRTRTFSQASVPTE